MPLSGINKKCQQCTESCKQWIQLIIVFCPNFRSRYPSHRDKTSRRLYVEPKSESGMLGLPHEDKHKEDKK